MIHSWVARLMKGGLVLLLAGLVATGGAQTVITNAPDESATVPSSSPPPLLTFVSPDASLVARPADAAPQVPLAPAAPPMSLKLEAMRDVNVKPQTKFAAKTPSIIIRWHGENLPVGGTVRVAWVAEDVGDLVESGFVIDQTRTQVETSKFGARFTISRPRDGWAPGKYRVDLFVDDELKDTLGVTIEE
ncbi:MAG: hypothetical protein ACJ8HU_01015 [Chthoniobacterales bacterium]